jgi:hypothetical protein
MRSLFCLNLLGVDEVVEEGTILHMSGFDPLLKTSDLIVLFGDLKVQIRWINDTSALAVLSSDPEKGIYILRKVNIYISGLRMQCVQKFVRISH